MGKAIKVTIYVTGEMKTWLDAKADEGYKRSSLVKSIILERMRKGVLR